MKILKLLFGMIFFYFCLSNSAIEYKTNNSSLVSSIILSQNQIVPPLIPATPIKNENWNEYIVLSGNNFINNYYINPIRIKKKE
jgi:hypothetical protein